MDRPLRVGAVMYDPKVSVIWEIIRDFFEAQHSPIDVSFYSTYDLQVSALLDGEHRHRLELAARLARLAAPFGKCLSRDCHARYRSRSHVVPGGPLRRRGADGGGSSRPRDCALARRTRRKRRSFRSDCCGRTGVIPDTRPHGAPIRRARWQARRPRRRRARGVSSVSARRGCGLRDARSQLGRVDARRDDRSRRFAILARDASASTIACSPSARTLDAAAERRWLEALFAMRYDVPAHREMMDLEGLKAWLPGRTSGFAALDGSGRGRTVL